jgi:hypothetical protein
LSFKKEYQNPFKSLLEYQNPKIKNISCSSSYALPLVFLTSGVPEKQKLFVKPSSSFCVFRNIIRKYKFHNKGGLCFVSSATVYWIDVFTRQDYFNVLLESVNYCRAEKGMELYAYCFIPSHACPERSRRAHFIFRSSNDQPMELLRGFKKFGLPINWQSSLKSMKTPARPRMC